MSGADPQVGERVIIYGGSGTSGQPRYSTVDRLTKTMVITTSGQRFRRDSFHREVGKDWEAAHLCFQDDPAWASRAQEVELNTRIRSARHWGRSVQENPTDPEILRRAARRFLDLAEWHEETAEETGQ